MRGAQRPFGRCTVAGTAQFEFEKPEHGVHRRTDFVAHVRQKIAFSAVGQLGAFLRFLDLLLEKFTSRNFRTTKSQTIAQFYACKPVPARRPAIEELMLEVKSNVVLNDSSKFCE